MALLPRVRAAFRRRSVLDFYLLAAFAMWVFALGPDPTLMDRRALVPGAVQLADAAARVRRPPGAGPFLDDGAGVPERGGGACRAALAGTHATGRRRARVHGAADRRVAARVPGPSRSGDAPLAAGCFGASRPSQFGSHRSAGALPADVRSGAGAAVQRLQRIRRAALLRDARDAGRRRPPDPADPCRARAGWGS